MPTNKNDTQTEDAPQITNGEETQGQFAETDEMYTVGRSYKRESEAAAELSSKDIHQPATVEKDESDSHANSTLGWVGLVLAFASFFFWPLVLAISGIVVGAIAKRQDAHTLGNIAIIVSVASLAYYLIFTNLF